MSIHHRSEASCCPRGRISVPARSIPKITSKRFRSAKATTRTRYSCRDKWWSASTITATTAHAIAPDATLRDLPRKCQDRGQQQAQTTARMRRMTASLLGQSAAIAVRHALLRRTGLLRTVTEGTAVVFARTSSSLSSLLLSTPSPWFYL